MKNSVKIMIDASQIEMQDSEEEIKILIPVNIREYHPLIKRNLEKELVIENKDELKDLEVKYSEMFASLLPKEPTPV